MKQPLPSLTQHFDAPDEWVGRFALLCGYSADTHFLNEALERFTRQGHAQRAAVGQTAMALILEPGRGMISPVDVPGLVHLPLRDAGERPFRLLHAKVALLGFRPVKYDGRWKLRLIVSTGNWTRQTLEESIDLFWTIEIDSAELNQTKPTDDLLARRADIAAAWRMMRFLLGLFDTRLLERGEQLADGGVQAAFRDLSDWLKRARRKGKSRFIDNRRTSFLAQLPDLVSDCAGPSARNYLAMGSGFFEGASGEAIAPAVLNKIVDRLRHDSLLTRSAEIDIFVNPSACQAIAGAQKAIKACGWAIRKAEATGDRTLHGKFLFGATKRKDRQARLNPHVYHPWVYLGSGNLTGPGFTKAMSPSAHGGNLEAGVLFHPDRLTWISDQDGHSVRDHLPIQDDHEFTDAESLHSGEPAEPLGEPFIAPPVAWLDWTGDAAGGRLVSPSGVTAFTVLDTSGIACPRDEEGFVWTGDQPRQVRIAWDREGALHQSQVPVCDAFGRLAATPLTSVALNEVADLLAGFPAVVDEGDEAGDSAETGSITPARRMGAVEVAESAIRSMMELVERIASQQCAIAEADWGAWCVRLEQTFSRVPDDSPILVYFRALQIDPLSPLLHKAFRPDFAMQGQPAVHYDAMLGRIGKVWGTANLAPLGEIA